MLAPKPAEPRGKLTFLHAPPYQAVWQSVPALSNAAAMFLPTGRAPIPWHGRQDSPGTSLQGLIPPSPHSKRLTQKTLSETGYLDLNFSTRLFVFFSPLSSIAKIPDPAVAKIKDFLPSFLPRLSFRWLGKTKRRITVPLPNGEGARAPEACCGIGHYSAWC